MNTASKPKSSKSNPRSSRRHEIINGAIDVLAQYGSRGFTHREIDRYLKYPEGSTSNYFRRREDLLCAVGARIMELDLQDTSAVVENLTQNTPITIERTTSLLLELFVKWMLPSSRNRALARMEIVVERIRNQELRLATQDQISLAEKQFQTIFEIMGSKHPAQSSQIFVKLIANIHLLMLEDIENNNRILLNILLRDWLTLSLEANINR